MPDPFTIVGTASAVAGIIRLLTSTISTLREPDGQWEDADFVRINLVAQLNMAQSCPAQDPGMGPV